MEIERVIEKMMNEDFVKYLTAEWNRPITNDADIDNIEEERLLSIIYGMLKLQKFNFVNTFREEAFTAIKTNVKQTVIETLSHEDNVEISRIDTNLFEQLKCLSMDQWLQCLASVFDRLETLLKRVSLVYSVISNGFSIVTHQQGKESDSTPQENGVSPDLYESSSSFKVILQSDYYELSCNLKEILCSICDFAHSHCTSIVDFRVNDANLVRLDSSDFMSLIALIDEFANFCEQVCGKKSPILKSVIQIQSNKFVTKFHEDRRAKLERLLNSEQWKSVNSVNVEFEILCSQLVNIETYSSLMDVYKTFKSSRQTSSPSSNVKRKTVVSVALSNDDNDKYVLVNSVINVVILMMEYAECACQISFLASHLLLRLIDLLKLFNSRTSQLILGGEALQITEMKTISARTLMITGRCLQFVVRFIPRIRIHFEELLLHPIANGNASQPRHQNMLKHLDELVELYENHYVKLPEKVVSLVREVVVSNMNKWVAKAPIPSACFVTMASHLKTLHDNVQDVIPRSELISLFQNIHKVVMQVFREHLIKLNITNNGGPQHG